MKMLGATVKGVYDRLYFVIENNITVPKVKNHTVILNRIFLLTT